MKKIIDIRSYSPSKTDNFIFDTNVWLYLFCPLGGYKTLIIKDYEDFLVKIIKVNSGIYLSSLILSEFINSYIRLDFNIKKHTNPNQFVNFKKDYRPSQDYSNTVSTVRATLKQQIIRITKNIDDGFSNYNLTDIINNIDKSDFNDLCTEELSSISNLKIVTDDKDFKISTKTIEVLTSNPKLLNP
ncbi:MAG: hypothetical protein KJ666_12015 [Bacteroidetes bacterium]|nr:hypothetical protein [Bacteroidota bacterium]MBU2583778.1 hypothetical protein [Bacteroidota bacterium]